MSATPPGRSIARAWTALMGALVIHVTDEVMSDFLPFYNEVAGGIRDRLGFGPPTFSFPVWLGGLILGIAAGFLLRPWIGRRTRRACWFAGVFGTLMVLNALLHLVGSLAVGRPLPGVGSAPILLIAAVWVVRESFTRAPRTDG